MGFGYGHGMNRLDFGIDPAPGLDKGSIFPFFQHGDIRHFQILNRINQKVVDQCSCFFGKGRPRDTRNSPLHFGTDLHPYLDPRSIFQFFQH